MRLSRLAFTSNAKTLIPVTLPPGFARFAMRPSATGSSPTPNTIGIVAVAAFAASEAGVLPGVAITATRRRIKLSSKIGQARILTFQPMVFDHDILLLIVADFAQPLPKGG